MKKTAILKYRGDSGRVVVGKAEWTEKVYTLTLEDGYEFTETMTSGMPNIKKDVNNDGTSDSQDRT